MAETYFPDDEADLEQQRLVRDSDDDRGDRRTPLDKTIDRIGMGSYQWTLLLLCGLGWMADNIWMQGVAIILPRVQQHYAIPDSYIGAVSSSMYAGMMVGSIGWGTCSDLMGRSMSFHMILFFTALFGVLASFSTSFYMLCIILFFLGSSVGGSLPTDGTLLLEHMPKDRQYLLTALSGFFSFGSVLAAVIALLVIPQNSCPISSKLPCQVDTQNLGWKYLLIILGLVTFLMFLARIAFFQLHESPRYLVHAGRPQDAVKSLQSISRFNGSDISIECEDVRDHNHVESRPISTLSFSENIVDNGLESPTKDSSALPQALRTGTVAHYASIGENSNLDSHNLMTPTLEPSASPSTVPAATKPSSAHRATRIPRKRQDSTSRRSSVYERTLSRRLPRWIRRPVSAWWSRVKLMLAPEWRTTTLLVWCVWFFMSIGFTIFIVFLPKLLETRSNSKSTVQPTLEESLWEVVVFTVGGCPSALVGAYLVRTSRRWPLAGSLFLSAFFCVVFVLVESKWAISLSTMGASLSMMTSWAVLCGWTPEIFDTKIRGTACGVASALSRIGAMIAPMLGGFLLTINTSIPVYTSVVIFVITGFCVLLLKEEAGNSARDRKESNESSVLH